MLAACQLRVTVLLFRAEEYETHQKWLQFGVIWLVPLLGAVIVHLMLGADRAPQRKDDPNFTPHRFGQG